MKIKVLKPGAKAYAIIEGKCELVEIWEYNMSTHRDKEATYNPTINYKVYRIKHMRLFPHSIPAERIFTTKKALFVSVFGEKKKAVDVEYKGGVNPA